MVPSLLLACHPAVPVAAPVPERPVEAAALQHFLTGEVALAGGDAATAARAGRWMLLVDSGAWTGVRAAELLVGAGEDADDAVDRVFDALGRLPPCEAAAVLDALERVRPGEPRIAPARTERPCLP